MARTAVFRIVLLMVVAWLAIGLPATAQTASGRMTVAGKTTPLAHAYARAQPGFFDKNKEDVLVILSDVDMPEAALADEFERGKMAREGKLHAIEIVLNEEKQVISGGVYHEAFARTGGSFSASGMHEFEAKVFDKKTVSGKAYTAKPSDFMDTKWEYTATFEAPIWRRAAPTASGAAAAKTPQGQVVFAFLKAARAGDKAALKKVLSADGIKELDGKDSKDMLDMMKMMMPDPAKAEIGRLDVSGNTAQVEVIEKSKDGSSTNTIKLVLENGVWKVGGPA